MFYIKYKYKFYQEQFYLVKNLPVKGRERRVRIGNDC